VLLVPDSRQRRGPAPVGPSADGTPGQSPWVNVLAREANGVAGRGSHRTIHLDRAVSALGVSYCVSSIPSLQHSVMPLTFTLSVA
jgi:hypothetical protein